MRVISQDGRIDYPYKQSIVFIDPRGTHTVLIQPVGERKGFALGIYSTEEKAIKAMEALRETYTHPYIRYFQFPQDSEIEVQYETKSSKRN